MSNFSCLRLQTTIEYIEHLTLFVQTVDDGCLPITDDAVAIDVAFCSVWIWDRM